MNAPTGAAGVDRDPVFRAAQLTLLLDVLSRAHPGGTDIERLAVYDFLAEHPLLLARHDSDPDRVRLRLAGFDDRALSYASAAQRFIGRRLRLPADLAWLIARGIVGVSAEGRVRYRITDVGHRLATSFRSMYAGAYTDAARIVVGRLGRTSDRRLRESLREWLAAGVAPRLGAWRR
jgi:hypothetical protein